MGDGTLLSMHRTTMTPITIFTLTAVLVLTLPACVFAQDCFTDLCDCYDDPEVDRLLIDCHPHEFLKHIPKLSGNFTGYTMDLMNNKISQIKSGDVPPGLA